MIKNVKLENFKCFSNQEFPLNKVNVFSGYNGRGKSSLLQSILLLSQSVHENDQIDKIITKGKFIDLGSFDELLNDDKIDSFKIDLDIIEDSGNESSVNLEYSFPGEDDFSGTLSSFLINEENKMGSVTRKGASDNVSEDKIVSAIAPEWLKNTLRSVYYIGANRVGPMKYVENHGRPKEFRVKPDGSETISTLSQCDAIFSKNMLPPGAKSDAESLNIIELASAWLEYIMHINSHSEISIPEKQSKESQRKGTSTLSLLFKDEKGLFSAYNVGFGYSYVLSIIVAALLASKGSILIIENPEAHLHGQAQSRLTTLLSIVAENGVQVFVETHSEHIVNGFRLAAVSKESNLRHDNVNIFFFDFDYSVKALTMKPNGKIEDWPEGFFDQAQHDIALIMRLGSQNAQ